MQESEKADICVNSVCWTWECSCTHELTDRSCGCTHKTCTKPNQPNLSISTGEAQGFLNYQMSYWQLMAAERVKISLVSFRDVDPEQLPVFGNSWSYTHAHPDSTKWTQWVLKEGHEDGKRGERERGRAHDVRRKRWWEKLRGGNVLMNLIQTLYIFFHLTLIFVVILTGYFNSKLFF